jgi:uncharacterized membrane protein YgcG
LTWWPGSTSNKQEGTVAGVIGTYFFIMMIVVLIAWNGKRGPKDIVLIFISFISFLLILIGLGSGFLGREEAERLLCSPVFWIIIVGLASYAGESSRGGGDGGGDGGGGGGGGDGDGG